MSLWQVRTDSGSFSLGKKRQALQAPGGCNQPFKSSFWCPRRHWFFRDPCPFTNRLECENFRRMCGGL